jgi:hypothetical protein
VISSTNRLLSAPRLQRYVRRTVEGMHLPPVFEADDGHEYVLKLDTLDSDFPVAEIVAAVLADALCIPLPHWGLLQAPDVLTEALQTSGVPFLVEFGMSFARREGRCFGSRWLDGALERWNPRMRGRWPEADVVLARLWVFDAFIENLDRSSVDNPNLMVSNGCLFAIDHGQALPSVQGVTGKFRHFPHDSHLAWATVRERPELVSEPLHDLATLPDAAIDDAVGAVPAAWWPSPDRPDKVRHDLRTRRDALPARLAAATSQSP